MQGGWKCAWENLVRRLTPRGMANKLFAVIVAIGLLLVLSLGIIVSSISGKLLYDDAKVLLDNQARQTVNVFDQYIDILKNTVMSTERQKAVQSLIAGNSSGYESYLVYRDAYDYLKNINTFFEGIHVYVVVTDKQYIMSSNPQDIVGNYAVRGIDRQSWFQGLEGSPGGTMLVSDFVTPSAGQESFAYAMRVRDIYRWRTKGYVLASVNKEILNKMIQGTSFETNGFLMILTPEGQVAYNSNPQRFAGNFSLEELLVELGDSSSFASDRNPNYYYSATTSQSTGWRFVAFTEKQHAKAQMFSLLIWVGVAAGSTILLLIVAARFTAKAYIRPLGEVIRFIHQAERDEFATRIELEAEDEVEELVDSFNSMALSVRQNQILRKRAEIDSLQKQINPHFLFNTFESIKVLAQQGDRRGVVSMVEKLSDMFRYNTNRDGAQVTAIRDEITHIQNYLDIQRVRFGSRMDVSYVIDGEILNLWTMKFILQPIVENSISHSMEQMTRPYRLEITGRLDGRDVLFTIRDNGVGIPEDVLARLRAYVFDETGAVRGEGFGIGLRNIQERLRLFYGDGYGLSLDSAFGDFTQIQVRIPAQRQKPDGDGKETT